MAVDQLEITVNNKASDCLIISYMTPETMNGKIKYADEAYTRANAISKVSEIRLYVKDPNEKNKAFVITIPALGIKRIIDKIKNIEDRPNEIIDVTDY